MLAAFEANKPTPPPTPARPSPPNPECFKACYANIKKVCHEDDVEGKPTPGPSPKPPSPPPGPSKACMAALKEGCRQCIPKPPQDGMLAAFEANKPTPSDCFKKCFANIQKLCHFGPKPHPGPGPKPGPKPPPGPGPKPPTPHPRPTNKCAAAVKKDCGACFPQKKGERPDRGCLYKCVEKNAAALKKAGCPIPPAPPTNKCLKEIKKPVGFLQSTVSD